MSITFEAELGLEFLPVLTKPFGKITSRLHRFKVEGLVRARIDLLIMLLHKRCGKYH